MSEENVEERKTQGRNVKQHRGCQWTWLLQAVCFLVLFGMILLPVSYMVRTNGDVKDRFAGFYAEKKDSLDVVMIGSSPVFPYYAAPKLWGRRESPCTRFPQMYSALPP